MSAPTNQVEFEFEKLILYQEARAFRRRIYKLAKLLPKDEFKLKVQMRDAARSLTNCIAEGHGRYTFKDRIHFCRQSRGSLLELIDDTNICDDEGYAEHMHLMDLRCDGAKLLRRLNGFLKYLGGEARKADGRKRPRNAAKPIAADLPITNY